MNTIVDSISGCLITGPLKPAYAIRHRNGAYVMLGKDRTKQTFSSIAGAKSALGYAVKFSLRYVILTEIRNGRHYLPPGITDEVSYSYNYAHRHFKEVRDALLDQKVVEIIQLK